MTTSTRDSHEILEEFCESADSKLNAFRAAFGNKNAAQDDVIAVMVLSLEENIATFILNLHSQWCNGGIHQWISNGYAITDQLSVIKILAMMDNKTCSRVLEMVEEAVEIYESAGLDDFDEDDEGYSDSAIAKLDALDIEYYAMETAMLDVVAKWLTEHKE